MRMIFVENGYDITTNIGVFCFAAPLKFDESIMVNDPK
jgi:hypothetical protein